jgi:hypothetical protein
MIRWFVILAAALALSGCATTYRGYGDYGSQPVAVGASSYYSPAYAASYGHGQGDYYYGRAPARSYSHYPSYHYPMWLDNPYYYSLFWPLQRSFYDPFWNPGFYYGVTYFPRNYFSLSLYGGPRGYYSRWGGRAYYGFAYSPYRLAWVDHYFDWYPYHRYYPRHVSRWYAPRYGNARHEAERLTRYSRQHANYASSRGLPRTDHRARLDASPRHQLRGAEQGRTAARLDPGVRGFDRLDARQRTADHQRATAARIDPGVRGFDRPDPGQRSIDRQQATAARIDPGVRSLQRGTDDTEQRGRLARAERFERGSGIHEGRGPRRDALTAPGTQQRSAYRVVDSQRELRREAGFAFPERGSPEARRHYEASERAAPRAALVEPAYQAPVRQAQRHDLPQRQYAAPAPRQAPQHAAPQSGHTRSPQYGAPPHAAPQPRHTRAPQYSAPPNAAPQAAPMRQAPAPQYSAPRQAAAAPAPARESRSEARSAAPDRGESRAASRLDRR